VGSSNTNILVGLLINLHNLKIVSYNKLDIESLIIVEYIDNEINFVFLDFFFSYSIFGIETRKSSEVLESRIFNGK
jgi:hypothetical protein